MVGTVTVGAVTFRLPPDAEPAVPVAGAQQLVESDTQLVCGILAAGSFGSQCTFPCWMEVAPVIVQETGKVVPLVTLDGGWVFQLTTGVTTGGFTVTETYDDHTCVALPFTRTCTAYMIVVGELTVGAVRVRLPPDAVPATPLDGAQQLMALAQVASARLFAGSVGFQCTFPCWMVVAPVIVQETGKVDPLVTLDGGWVFQLTVAAFEMRGASRLITNNIKTGTQ